MEFEPDIEALKRGDEKAYQHVFDAFGSRVYNTALGFLGQREEAEDVTQEVFVQVFESITSFRGDSSLSTWIYRIAVNKSLEKIRRERKKSKWALAGFFSGKVKENEIVPDFEHPGIVLEKQEVANELYNAISQLPDNQRSAFTLHKLEQMSYAEISDVLGVSLSAVESLMHRARQNLKKTLEDFYEQQKYST